LQGEGGACLPLLCALRQDPSRGHPAPRLQARPRQCGCTWCGQVSFEQIEEGGLEPWLAGLREELVSKTYRPDPVRRVMIPKNGGGERALGKKWSRIFAQGVKWISA
jgi:hypothetical protein